MSVKNRGFASMPKERVRELAQLGGRKAWENGSAHKWNPQSAADAGRKGAASRARAARDADLSGSASDAAVS